MNPITDHPNQIEFNITDEDKVLAFLKDSHCPLCHLTPFLVRRRDRHSLKNLFFVCCQGNSTSKFIRNCSQTQIPVEGASDSETAVRAWKVYCKLVS